MRPVPACAPVLAMFVVLIPAALSGCRPATHPAARTPDEALLFGPRGMRVHPIFSQVKDWTGDGKPDGVEALLEFEDAFGDPTKAAGTVVFELFDYRPYNPDPRGDRLASAWIGSLRTLDEQRARWNRTSRTYAFQLQYPEVRFERNYVLTAAFDRGPVRAGAGPGGAPAPDTPGTSDDARDTSGKRVGRFFDQIVLEAQRPRPPIEEAPAASPPATRAAAVDPPTEPLGEQQQSAQPAARHPAP